MMTSVEYALKEWPAAIHALELGTTCVLFRKGGLHEHGATFALPVQHALLFPSFEHQNPSMLKSVDGETLPPYCPGAKISISSWVEFRACLEVKDCVAMTQLRDLHIWTDEFVAQRLAWKPERPLFVLVCFTRQFYSPIEIEYRAEYGGCKSWIQLEANVFLPESSAVKTDDEFSQILERLQNILN